MPRAISSHYGLAAALFAMALWSAGCGGGADTRTAETPASGTSATGEHSHDHDHDHGHGHDHAEMSSDVEASLAELSPEDRAVAEAQQVCAVAGEPLGSMGAPIKVEHEGKPVFLCCEGCKKAFEADPEKYIAKLPNWQDESSTTTPETEGDAPAESTDTPAESTETPVEEPTEA